MIKKILMIGILVLLVGCGSMRSWTDIELECEDKYLNESCGYSRCLYENSASFTTHDKTRLIYLDCMNINHNS